MGCCDSLPDVPMEIIPDPDTTTPEIINISKMGYFSHDYAIYQGNSSCSIYVLFLLSC